MAEEAHHPTGLPRNVRVGWTDQYIGIPYLDLGRDRAGCDCWGLHRLVVFEQTGLLLPEYGIHFQREPLAAVRAFRRAVAGEEWELVSDAPRDFDAVWMRCGARVGDGRVRGVSAHIGTWVSGRYGAKVLHVEDPSSCSFLEPVAEIKNRIVGIYRPRANVHSPLLPDSLVPA